MKVVFFGTPEFALPALKELCGAFELAAVVTQPDKPKGRSRKPRPSPVKEWAVAHGVPVLEPASLKNNPRFVKELLATAPDIGVAAAYGKILPPEVLKTPRFGIVNIHGSILPRWRGAAPIQRAVMAGDKKTGATIMRMVEELDAGDIYKIVETDIGRDDTGGSISARLAELGARALIEVINEIAGGSEKTVAQDETLVTYAPPLSRADAIIHWDRSAGEIDNLVRAMAPKPGAYTGYKGKRLKILKTTPEPDISEFQDKGQKRQDLGPGELLVEGERMIAATGDGPLEMLLLQPEGKKVMNCAEFCRGHRPHTGDRFESDKA